MTRKSQLRRVGPAGQIVVPLRKRNAVKHSNYHFVGIGGCGMSGLAQVLAQRGYRVSGSDISSSAVTDKLATRGIPVTIGHDPADLSEQVDCVVVSAAVKKDNPQWRCALQRGVRVYKYAELLGQISHEMDTVAIAGTHGKSTTSAWLAHLLTQAGKDPSFVIGAQVDQLGGGSGAGQGRHLVVEACEYDRSFLNLQPAAAAILNIEADHLDYYRDLDEIIEAFNHFAQRLRPHGLLVANGDDENVTQALKDCSGDCQFFSLKSAAHWQAQRLEFEAGHGCCDILAQGRTLGRVKLGVPGRHNVANALAVAALGRQAGLSDAQICAGLESFAGAGRRLTYRGTAAGVVILDDYAHHPTEIRATLAAIQGKYQPQRLWCVFQPHQHSRTRFLLREFAGSFDQADIVLLPEIYFVRDSEDQKQAINAEKLAQAIAAQGRQAYYLGDFTRIAEHLCRGVQAGDVVVTMGAGDVWKLTDELICRLR